MAYLASVRRPSFQFDRFQTDNAIGAAANSMERLEVLAKDLQPNFIIPSLGLMIIGIFLWHLRSQWRTEFAAITTMRFTVAGFENREG